MNLKLIFSSLAITLTLVAFISYIRSILAGNTKPHVFSWVIWGITTIIVFFAQLTAKGGVGAWPMGVSGIITIFIAILAFFKHTDSTITKTDWLFFIIALASIPFWYITSNPLCAVIILTTVDLLGFGPTIRKANAMPHEENISFFSLFIIRNSFTILALEHYSLTTILFPFAVSIACLLLVMLITYRRHLVFKQ